MDIDRIWRMGDSLEKAAGDRYSDLILRKIAAAGYDTKGLTKEAILLPLAALLGGGAALAKFGPRAVRGAAQGLGIGTRGVGNIMTHTAKGGKPLWRTQAQLIHDEAAAVAKAKMQKSQLDVIKNQRKGMMAGLPYALGGAFAGSQL